MCNDLSPKYPSLVKLHDQKVAEVNSRFWFTFYGEDSWMNSGKSPGRPNREAFCGEIDQQGDPKHQDGDTFEGIVLDAVKQWNRFCLV